ncbi:MAG: undecaprenyl/decaprenyl-phosphate alpha-N-acetylglucosaminyl 1-phosphate transferase [Clostridiales Family XIII bacterium]|nr:undecaprenyl/decaprenyl-phosphate alpha-N-acetylglucosaminyl 1-phosphate transferase [Clostridiales Family XIII bacterium]
MSDKTAMILIALVCFVLPVILSAVLTPVAIRIAPKIGAMDVPRDTRRMHKLPIPRFGGFAIFIAMTVTILCLRFVIFPFVPEQFTIDEPVWKLVSIAVGGTLIYILGVVDDFLKLRAVVKLIFEIVCAAVVFFLGIRIPAINLFGLEFAGNSIGNLIISFFVTVLWIVFVTNTINLIDGLDGLAAGVTALAALSIGYSAYLSGQTIVTLSMLVCAGAALGFLPYNFYPAKIFMGDSGALFLGFMLASVSVIGPAKGAAIIATIVPVLVLGVPIFDVLFAVLRRLIHRQSIFSADKAHLHHQLTHLGMGQRRSVLMLYGISAIMGISAIIFSRRLYLESVFLFCTALLFIILLIWEWNKDEK